MSSLGRPLLSRRPVIDVAFQRPSKPLLGDDVWILGAFFRLDNGFQFEDVLYVIAKVVDVL
jgi:hypothetical protein